MIELVVLNMVDLEWVRQLRNRNRMYFIEDSEISHYEFNKWFQRFEYKKTLFYFVIKDEGKNVGTISVYDKEKYRLIGDMVIDEQHRGQGILKEALSIILDRYASPYQVEIRWDNKIVRDYFEKLGFINKSITLWKT